MSKVSSQDTYAMVSWAARMADSILPNYPPSQWRWHYEHGLFIKAVYEVGRYEERPRFQQFVREWVDHFVTPDGNIRTYRLDEYNLDQINPGKLLFSIYHRTGDERYRCAIDLLLKQLNQQPRTTTGNYWHKKIYPDQVWLDGLYMAAPFISEYASVFNRSEYFDDISNQILSIERRVRDPLTGLLYHGWDESRRQKWADPDTGCSSQFWGRAIGWYLMSIVDVLDFLPSGHGQRSELLAVLDRLSKALEQAQDPASGLWYQVLDQPGRVGNYRGSSVSAMLTYGFAKAVRKGYLSIEYLSAAQRAYRGLFENMIQVDARGVITLDGICAAGGLGGDPYRDGSFEYYIGEPVAPNDFKGVGPFILAALEMEAVGLVHSDFML